MKSRPSLHRKIRISEKSRLKTKPVCGTKKSLKICTLEITSKLNNLIKEACMIRMSEAIRGTEHQQRCQAREYGSGVSVAEYKNNRLGIDNLTPSIYTTNVLALEA